jgi:hypothetical protein
MLRPKMRGEHCRIRLLGLLYVLTLRLQHRVSCFERMSDGDYFGPELGFEEIVIDLAKPVSG